MDWTDPDIFCANFVDENHLWTYFDRLDNSLKILNNICQISKMFIFARIWLVDLIDILQTRRFFFLKDKNPVTIGVQNLLGLYTFLFVSFSLQENPKFSLLSQKR